MIIKKEYEITIRASFFTKIIITTHESVLTKADFSNIIAVSLDIDRLDYHEICEELLDIGGVFKVELCTFGQRIKFTLNAE